MSAFSKPGIDREIGEKGEEWKVLMALGLLILCLEMGARAFGSSLSKDLRHLESLPAAAERLRESGRDGLLIVGNSLAREGIDGTTVGQDYPLVERFHPDSSAIVEWRWGLGRYFLQEGAVPAEIWLVTGRSHLAGSLVTPEKLGAYFVGHSQIAEALRSLPGTEERLRFVAGYGFRLMGIRERVRPLVGYRFFPGFEAAWPELVKGRAPDPQEEKGKAPQNLESLERFLAISRQRDIVVTVILVPLPERYGLPHQVEQLLDEAGVRVIDLTQVPGLSRTHFPDGYHLNSEGARLTTEELLKALP